MKKVRMLINTAYKGPRFAGEVISVPDDYATRWSKNGIAEVVEEVEETEEVEADEPKPYEGMTSKELYALCKERGLDVEAKKSAKYYIEALESIEVTE